MRTTLVVVVQTLTCLHHVHHVVAEFLALGNEIDVEHAELIAVETGIDVVQILILQQRTVLFISCSMLYEVVGREMGAAMRFCISVRAPSTRPIIVCMCCICSGVKAS